MERSNDCHKSATAHPIAPRRVQGGIDLPSVIGGFAGCIGFFLFAMLSLSLSKFDSTLASVWIPNAAAVALLLRAQFASELPVYIGVFIASMISNMIFEAPLAVSAVFSLANIAGIGMIVGITRRGCGVHPDMTDISHLARFIWAGGVAGPALSASIASIAMFASGYGDAATATAWFLTEAMGMVLIVPAGLLAFDAWQSRDPVIYADRLEALALLICGFAGTFLVFHQNSYPLLFLIPPIALLHAFRLGSLGTALFVGGLAIVASAMTWAGRGPMGLAELSGSGRVYMLQAFLAANFLTGLPVAAILAGRQRIIEELADGKRQLDLLADNITDAVLRFDSEGRCTYASPSVREVLDEEPETFIGNLPTDRMHRDAKDRISLAQERLVSGESDKERFTYRRFRDAPDGTPVFIEADCAIAYDRGGSERQAIVVSARDVTERVELELLLTRARKHAENAVRAKSEFLANMSHEIRTPMNGVLGFAELMLQSDLDEDQRRQTQMIVQSGRSMMMLLNDILDLSKIEEARSRSTLLL